MHGQLSNGRRFRDFNVIDDYNPRGLGIESDFALPAERVIRALDQMNDALATRPLSNVPSPFTSIDLAEIATLMSSIDVRSSKSTK